MALSTTYPLFIEPYRLDNRRTVNVVRDDYLAGGTKMRGLVPYMKNILKNHKDVQEFLYASPAYGYAQVAISMAARDLGKKATIFVAKRKNKHPNTLLAEKFGAQIIEVPYGYLVVVKKWAKDYEGESPKTRYLLPWGLADPEFMRILEENIRKVSKKHRINPKVIWVTVGSGTLFETLASVFPDAVFNLVTVGADYKPSSTALSDRIKNIYQAPEKFDQKAKITPPFQSNPWYDAKLWRFILDHGGNNDLVWNVA